MTEIVLGPERKRFASHREKTEAVCAAHLEALAAAWRDNPADAFEWMVDNGIAHRIDKLLAPGPCRHVRVAMNGHAPVMPQACADCGAPIHPVLEATP